MATLVKFRYNEKNQDLFAYFPQLHPNENRPNLVTCYSHIGQHSQMNLLYAKESRPATYAEYRDLLMELESIGYNLKICK